MSVSRRADLQLTDLICYGTLHVPLMLYQPGVPLLPAYLRLSRPSRVQA